MEEFAQSRGDDDLFDDEIIPISATTSPEKVATQLSQVNLDSPSALDTVQSPPPNASFNTQKPRGRGRGGPTQRARGVGGASKRGGLADSKYAPKQPSTTPSTAKTTNGEEKKPQETSEAIGIEQSSSEHLEPRTEPSPPDTSPPTDPDSSTVPAITQPRTLAVRGDRTATGGVRKPKLTEEELSAKLAAAKERSQNVAAAHARAQADAANFEERERVAQEKRQKETVNRKEMEGEREKNRIRKMKALGGREWDSEKKEEDFMGGGGRRGGRRAMPAGEAEEHDLSMYEWHDDKGRGRGRGGGRGRAGRGGRGGRGGSFTPNQNQPNVNTDTDFPALPATAKKDVSSQQKPIPKRLDSEGAGGGSWADQVESSEAAKA